MITELIFACLLVEEYSIKWSYLFHKGLEKVWRKRESVNMKRNKIPRKYILKQIMYGNFKIMWFLFYHLHIELLHLNIVWAKISVIVFSRTSNSSHTLSSSQTMEPCTSDEFFQALNHAEQTFKKMENYLRHKQLCDVVLVAGDRRIPAHR